LLYVISSKPELSRRKRLDPRYITQQFSFCESGGLDYDSRTTKRYRPTDNRPAPASTRGILRGVPHPTL
jgi:hypothetical protein